MSEQPDNYECDVCGKVFYRKYNLQMHIENCHMHAKCQCPLCGRSFGSAIGLQQHMAKGHNTWDLCFPQCDLCSKTFTRKQNLISHMLTVHLNGSPSARCAVCDKSFSSERNLKRHNKLTHDPDTQFPTCNECNRTFKAKHSLVAHIQNHCTGFSEDKVAKCDLCNRVYTSHRNLRRHIETLHENKVNVFSCELCPKFYTSNQSLRRHVKSRHDPDNELSCATCNQTFPSEAGLEYHEKTTHRDKVYQCEDCDKYFMFPHKLKEHAVVCQSHMTSAMHQCTLCDKQFIAEPNLKHHIQTEHCFESLYSYRKDSLPDVPDDDSETEAVSYFNCEFCCVIFVEMSHLQQHMHAMHGKEFALSNCYVCYARFYSKESLVEHKKLCLIPNGAHSCNLCEKLFTERCSLDFHVRIFHPPAEADNDISSTNLLDDTVVDDGIPPMFKCIECARLYNSDRSLKHHMKLKHSTAEAVDCPICGKICINKYYLSSHLRIVHTTETVSKCDYCDKHFKSKRNIRRHIEYTHLGMQRYKCIECETLFKEKRSLRKHVRSKHNDSVVFPRCHICQKLFESAKSCKIHLKLVHSFNLNTHPCDLCNVAFGSFQALDRHLRTTHLAEDELYKCDDCNEVFKGQENFDAHNEAHHVTFARPQKVLPCCLICVKDFSTRKTLKRHIKKFHSELDVDHLVNYGTQKSHFSVECEACLRRFSDDFYYGIYLKLQHLRESIVFACEECSHAYSTVEYAFHRHRLRLADECRARMVLSELCTAEMSGDDADDEIALREDMVPESTTADVKLEPVDALPDANVERMSP